MRSYAVLVASRGSEVPSGSSPVYQRRRLGRDLIMFTCSVMAVEFMYELGKKSAGFGS